MRRLAIATALTLCFSASAEQWRSIPDSSLLRFASAYDGNAFDGEFEVFSVWMEFDPKQPESARLKVSVQTDSVQTGSGDRDGILRDSEWFASDEYPDAIFEGTDLSKGESRDFQLQGNLTIKGTTCSLTLEFDWSMDDDRLTIEGSALMTGDTIVDRTEFSLGTGDWADTAVIGAHVPVSFEIVLESE